MRLQVHHLDRHSFWQTFIIICILLFCNFTPFHSLYFLFLCFLSLTFQPMKTIVQTVESLKLFNRFSRRLFLFFNKLDLRWWTNSQTFFFSWDTRFFSSSCGIAESTFRFSDCWSVALPFRFSIPFPLFFFLPCSDLLSSFTNTPPFSRLWMIHFFPDDWMIRHHMYMFIANDSWLVLPLKCFAF